MRNFFKFTERNTSYKQETLAGSDNLLIHSVYISRQSTYPKPIWDG